MWRATAIAVQVGIFAPSGLAVDLTGFQYLQLTIAPNQNSPTNLITAVVLSSGITPTISQAAWLAGTAQQAEFDLSAAVTDITLFAQPSQPYWMSLTGVNAAGALIVLAAGTVNFYNSGSATPAPIASVVDFNAQTNATGNGTIAPMTNAHTEQLTITGSAGTRNFPIVPLSGLAAGARVWVAMVLPATVGITVNFLNLSLSGATLTSILTDGFSRSASLEFYFDGTNFNIESVALPAGY